VANSPANKVTSNAMSKRCSPDIARCALSCSACGEGVAFGLNLPHFHTQYVARLASATSVRGATGVLPESVMSFHAVGDDNSILPSSSVGPCVCGSSLTKRGSAQ
jgi:hypothetical protein